MNLLDMTKAAAAYTALFSALLLAGAVQAQTVYRIVGADGRVTFSDKPPVTAEQGKVASTGTGGAAAASASNLPTELRQAAQRYPVTLYTSADCGPCMSGRSMLNNRGIPFTERTVSSNEDIDALQRLSGDGTLPFLTIGSQRIKGFSDVEWSQYLDAAGYPKVSQLPNGFKQAAASPLAPAAKPTPKPEPKASAPTAPTAPVPSGPSPSNPAGIQF